MRIETFIEVADGRYNVWVATSKFTAAETEQLDKVGEPLINVGGTFSGTLARPGQTNTVVTITGGGGSGATATPVIVAGVITGFVVTAAGSGYTSTPTVGITGDGSGATATAVLVSQTLLSITVVSGGTGYHVVPTVVNLTLPNAFRRIRSDSPFKQVFDTADSVNADIYAQFFANQIVTELTAAKNAMMAVPYLFVGETVQTV